jgi:ribonuclease HII
MISNEWEVKSWADNNLLLGVDEAGMGCLAGSMYVGGVVFPKDYNFDLLQGLNDSKKMKPAKRVSLEIQIKEDALKWFCLKVTAQEVDDESAYWARLTSAAAHIVKLDPMLPDYTVLMDGNVAIETLPWVESDFLIKGDGKCYTLAAASVIAKCAKDREMEILHEGYPVYNWKKNKGYGTKEHQDALAKFGLTEYHRRTYCKKYLEKECISR